MMRHSKVKIYISILMAVALAISFSACVNDAPKDDGKLQIIATIFPQYDFAKHIVQDKAEVVMLLPLGAEGHTYEPTPVDMKEINDSDIFIYTGEYMEPWAQSIVESIDNKTLAVVDASRGVELIEGEHGHEDDTDINEGEDVHSMDPHIWLNPIYAKVMVDNILEAIVEKDPDNSDFYTANAELYKQSLDKLDADIAQAVNSAPEKTLVFGGRFAYAYLINQYHINYISAYEGCSSHDEPSVQSIVNVVEFIKSNDIKVIYHEELSDPKIAKSLAEQTGAGLLVLNTVHTLTTEEMEQGLTYIDMMYKNLENIKEGLGE